MKIIVTHSSPDWDGITSVWIIKRFFQGWENADVQFVPAGERLRSSVFGSRLSDDSQSVVGQSATDKLKTDKQETENGKLKTDNRNPIEIINGNEIIHVDTGLGPLDHHQTSNQEESAASRTWDFVKGQNLEFGDKSSEKMKDKAEAISRIVKIVVDIDHFKEVFWENPAADYHDFSLLAMINGLKLQKPNEDRYYVDFGLACLDALLHSFENRIWAEKEINQNGKKFTTRFGNGIGFETINDDVLQLAQKMGYVIVIRKDPRKGYVRIKARPSRQRLASSKLASSSGEKKLYARRYTLDADIDLTLVYEQLRKMDPDATWFLHVSKKMLLNGTAKNPKMKPTRLTLDEIIKVLEKI